jgi:hypothetical protein
MEENAGVPVRSQGRGGAGGRIISARVVPVGRRTNFASGFNQRTSGGLARPEVTGEGNDVIELPESMEQIF